MSGRPAAMSARLGLLVWVPVPVTSGDKRPKLGFGGKS
jgi:hypothetical protein